MLTSFVGDPVGTVVGLAEGEIEGCLLGLLEGDWLGFCVGCEMSGVKVE